MSRDTDLLNTLRKHVRKMVLLWVVNFLVFQWFWVRLVIAYDDRTYAYVGWRFIKGVVPLTGWWSPYRFVPRRH